MQFKQFFSLDSPKAIKARHFGYMNAINYMAPAALAGVGNLCPHASPGCLALCLGWYSGQAGMVKGNTKRGANNVRASRASKARLFMRDRASFMVEMIEGIKRAKRKADREGLKLCVRLNGATDISWERIRIDEYSESIVRIFPYVQFVDYTKNFLRMMKLLAAPIANYHVTFSRSETNEAQCLQVLAAGGNVAVVFAGDMPGEYLGVPVVDGDTHDLRHLDPKGVVIGLTPKGNKAKRDKSGFVVR